jgi:hypothetical protein
MCECAIHTPEEKHNWFGEKKYRLAHFFDQWWDTYCQNPKEFIQPEQYKAVAAIRVCRTAALGIDIYSCPECGDSTEVYHNCKNRFCPTCSWGDTVKWADKIKRNMLNIPHRHVVFTIPHALIPLIKRNEFTLLNMQMQVSAMTLKDWMEHKYGLRCGIISVLHTAGELKTFHSHVHMILSWGGIDKLGAIQQIKGIYVNYEFLMAKFRYMYEHRLVDFFDSGLLQHNFKNRVEFLQFLKRINQKNWIIHFEDPMETPAAVIRYIGRYSKRACLSEYKIVMMEDENIGFSYKDYKAKDFLGHPLEKEKILNYRDFFPLLLQHVPLPYFRLVRYYGIYSNKGHLPKEYFSQEEEIPVNWKTIQEAETGENPLVCQNCKIDKVYTHTTVQRKTGITKIIRGGLNPDQPFRLRREWEDAFMG